MTEEEVAKPGFENNKKIRNLILSIMKSNNIVLIFPYLLIDGVSLSVCERRQIQSSRHILSLMCIDQYLMISYAFCFVLVFNIQH